MKQGAHLEGAAPISRDRHLHFALYCFADHVSIFRIYLIIMLNSFMMIIINIFSVLLSIYLSGFGLINCTLIVYFQAYGLLLDHIQSFSEL